MLLSFRAKREIFLRLKTSVRLNLNHHLTKRKFNSRQNSVMHPSLAAGPENQADENR